MVQWYLSVRVCVFVYVYVNFNAAVVLWFHGVWVWAWACVGFHGGGGFRQGPPHLCHCHAFCSASGPPQRARR